MYFIHVVVTFMFVVEEKDMADQFTHTILMPKSVSCSPEHVSGFGFGYAVIWICSFDVDIGLFLRGTPSRL